ncbi:hypothetical protein ZWY2020_010951 [Hordeum vulgare]|nr:hypothetical protein ZWY2020_010951 [Hordeum vulgare]
MGRMGGASPSSRRGKALVASTLPRFASKGGTPPGNVDIELGLQGNVSGTAQPGLDGFFEQVREIEKLLETLAKLLKDLQNSNEESKVVTKASAMKDIKRCMEKDVNEVTKVARLTKSKLQQLNKEVKMKA